MAPDEPTVVDLRAGQEPPDDPLWPAVVVGVGLPVDAAVQQHHGAARCDVLVHDDHGLGALLQGIGRAPRAARALALLLRGAPRRSVADGLVAESSTYSLLQAGPEHHAWLAGRGPARPPHRDDASPVLVEVTRTADGAGTGDRLHVTLRRPHRRNAYSARMREELVDALTVALLDPTVTAVGLDGAGPSFCTGGDLDEFGTLTDPTAAHLLRLERSAAWALHRLRDRTTVHVHGACVGAGVELPSFAGRVVADPGATFRLPEVAMGLVPGAGGTVGITRRVGRHRLAWLALTGATLDAATALAWGLVDEIAAPDAGTANGQVVP